MELSPSPLTNNDYATYLVHRMYDTQKEFNAIKNDLRRSQQFYYNKNARFIDIDLDKRVFAHKPPSTSQLKRLATHFFHQYEGPYTVVEHVRGRSYLPKLRHEFTSNELPTVY